ncbi:MAG: AAA family ATPase, partial [Akkermansiaceae bacterium]
MIATYPKQLQPLIDYLSSLENRPDPEELLEREAINAMFGGVDGEFQDEDATDDNTMSTQLPI